MKIARLLRHRYAGLAVIAIMALGVSLLKWMGSDKAGIDVASPNPAWTLVVSNRVAGMPVEVEVLLRSGQQVRVLHLRTPAELRLGNRRIIAQFRPVFPVHRLDIVCTQRGAGFSSSASYDPDQGHESVTFVSTFGRLGIPRVGAFGWMNPKWGARERYANAWALWPDFWRPQTAEEEAALPPPEEWPGPSDSTAGPSSSRPN
jgi:hypothetical protein